jgi:hypothetical protein
MRRTLFLPLICLAGCSHSDPADDRLIAGQTVVFVNLESMPNDHSPIFVNQKDGELKVGVGTRAVVATDANPQEPGQRGRGSRHVVVRLSEGEHAGQVASAMRVWLRPCPQ